MKHRPAITQFARLAILRHDITTAGLKHSAVAHQAGITSGAFSMLWNGQKSLTDTYWPRITAAIQTLTS